MALLGVLLAGACATNVAPTASPAGAVTLTLDGAQRTIGGASCTWFEGTGQLYVEAGHDEGTDYLLLGAPLQWLGEKLPEGPGADPELTLRVGGSDRAVDQASLNGSMTLEQTSGTFLGRLADGTPVSGDWTCPEVTEEQRAGRPAEPA